ncbi:GGDEF domain-containing protein [Mesorhizobium sp.]|uniref:GGDEF domain-containing protein n=1 Tax=Mesorhizobium sp. TaxID=1871066 RepID=UPI003435D711
MLREVPDHLDAWSAEQALSEYIRLERLIATYQLGLTGAGAEQLGLRLDIMFGWIERQGTLHAYMESNPHRAALLSVAEELKPADFRRELKALARLERLPTALASSTAHSADTAPIAAGQDSLRRLHFIYTALAGGLIVCGICLILLLLHKNRLLNRAHIDMRRLADDLRETSREILAQSERLAHMARHDALTGLANRFLFRQELDRRLSVGSSNRASVVVLFLDLDGFKDINDSFGYDVGDCLLVKVSERLKEATSPEDMTCRLGGNEFAVLTEASSEQDASERAQGPLAKMAGPVHIDGRELSIGTSIGVSFARGNLDSGVVLKHADLAVHEAKRLGRGQACLFLPEMHSRMRESASKMTCARLCPTANSKFTIKHRLMPSPE